MWPHILRISCIDLAEMFFWLTPTGSGSALWGHALCRDSSSGIWGQWSCSLRVCTKWLQLPQLFYVTWFQIPSLSWLLLFWTLSDFLCLSQSVEHRAEHNSPDVLWLAHSREGSYLVLSGCCITVDVVIS